ncbi:hypothetical protein BH10BAC2_BH10BAC2_18340 [soil metagenome]
MVLLTDGDIAKLAVTADTIKVIIHNLLGDFSRRLSKRGFIHPIYTNK